MYRPIGKLFDRMIVSLKTMEQKKFKKTDTGILPFPFNIQVYAHLWSRR